MQTILFFLLIYQYYYFTIFNALIVWSSEAAGVCQIITWNIDEQLFTQKMSGHFLKHFELCYLYHILKCIH